MLGPVAETVPESQSRLSSLGRVVLLLDPVPSCDACGLASHPMNRLRRRRVSQCRVCAPPLESNTSVRERPYRPPRSHGHESESALRRAFIAFLTAGLIRSLLTHTQRTLLREAQSHVV